MIKLMFDSEYEFYLDSACWEERYR